MGIKLKVYKENKGADQDVYLALEEGVEEGGVQLVAVNERGETLKCGLILRIQPQGIQRYLNLDPELGFELVGASGRIAMDE